MKRFFLLLITLTFALLTACSSGGENNNKAGAEENEDNNGDGIEVTFEEPPSFITEYNEQVEGSQMGDEIVIPDIFPDGFYLPDDAYLLSQGEVPRQISISYATKEDAEEVIKNYIEFFEGLDAEEVESDVEGLNASVKFEETGLNISHQKVNVLDEIEDEDYKHKFYISYFERSDLFD